MINQTVNTAQRLDLARYQRARRRHLFLALIVLSGFLMITQSAWTDLFSRLLISGTGIVLMFIGILGRVWCTFYIGGRKSHEVVSHGPYSMMRNPLYFFSSIAAVGAGAQSGSIIIGLLLGLLCVVAFLIVIKKEEAFLSLCFGKEYALYCALVPRFLPNLRLFDDLVVVSITPQLVYKTLFDGLMFLSTVPLFSGVSYAQHLGFLPVYFRFY
jgi:protein-S-isoprenylcysteine O-methyltransferase Ste14